MISSNYKASPDPSRPNTICELPLQLCEADQHRLPDRSKLDLVELVQDIREDDRKCFQKLRGFVAGNLTWEDANKDCWSGLGIATASNWVLFVDCLWLRRTEGAAEGVRQRRPYILRYLR